MIKINDADRLKIYTSDTEWVHIDREDVSYFHAVYPDAEGQNAVATLIAGGKHYVIKGECDWIRHVHLWYLQESQSLPVGYFMDQGA